ncbi:TMEM175 family protein [Nocardia sp. NPDC046473]|uniref:TMEM175 family protein n=1 Tax=Nocardia sp. NPDC046473 TaxID=3155733 RepID=UPI0033EA2F3C
MQHSQSAVSNEQSATIEVRPSNTARVEAFSDAVMAIAITLLVLEIRLPEDSDESLLHQLLRLWPSYLAYVASFLTIGVIWLCHHNFFARIRRVDGLLQSGNLLLLFCVGFLPFPTAALAHHLEGSPWDARVATAFYGIVAAVQAGAWIVMWVALRRNPSLFEPGYDAAFVRSESRQAWVGFIAFDIIAVIALASPIVALILYVLATLAYGITSNGLHLLRRS